MLSRKFVRATVPVTFTCWMAMAALLSDAVAQGAAQPGAPVAPPTSQLPAPAGVTTCPPRIIVSNI